MCVIKDASLAANGQLRYRLRDQAGNELWACASSIIRIGDSVTIARSAQQNVGEQLEVPWVLEGSSLRHESAKTDVGLILGEAEDELIAYFSANKERLRNIEPRVFEKLVLAIYKNHGFDVTPIGAWNQKDGGVDIIAVYKSVGITELRLAIQCKCSRNKISAEPIRALAGVLDYFKAHQGVLCTTSHFTAAAVSERDHLWRVTLEDRDKLFSKLRALKF
jgi:restriction endonuclease Mrr